jgi:hypothetical protein
MTTTERRFPSITAAALQSIRDPDAITLVDRVLGNASLWPSPLIKYRFTSSWQADWKAELGHWLHTADRLGFLDVLVDRVVARARRRSRSKDVDPNDQRHLDLVSEMAPAMVAHYLSGTGWTFQRWEPVRVGTGDVDIQFAAPDGTFVNLQVKAPDQPGGRRGGHVVDGEYDDRVVTALRKGAGQLLPFPSAANLVVICARRGWPLFGQPEPIVTYLYGSTSSNADQVWLPQRDRGWFFTPWWKHVGGVVLLDFVRNVDRPIYGCTVLGNPLAQHRVESNWFPYSYVCRLDDNRFRWFNGEPGGFGMTSIPDGTLLVDYQSDDSC